jgi:nifR3 family TIM-barrel protein
MNFWKEVRNNKKPFFCVAPMADVTDAAFRRLISKYGKPDVMWTEFVSANGLMSKGREILSRDLEYSEIERPIIAQLFSSDPTNMEGAAKLAAELGFDGIDINMGCPDKTIEKQGAGAAMIKDPAAALAVIAAAKRGIAAAGRDIPLSVKTRVGYNAVQINEWIPLLLSSGIAALTVHARTRKDLSKVPAHWDYLKQVVALRDELAPETVIIGNGDVTSLADGKEKAARSGVDGVMVGRALFGNPWFFDEERQVVAALPKRSIFYKIPILKKLFDTKRVAPTSLINPISTSERLHVLVEHTKLFEQLLGDIKSFAIMKKHYKAYCTGFVGAKELRMELMEAKDSREVEGIVNTFLTKV